MGCILSMKVVMAYFRFFKLDKVCGQRLICFSAGHILTGLVKCIIYTTELFFSVILLYFFLITRSWHLMYLCQVLAC